jgi:hypothetical protein
MDGDDEDIEELKGPALAPPPALQTKLAPYLLKLFKETVLDESYVNRLRRHYGMFKRAIEDKNRPRSRSSRSRPRRKSKKRSGRK